MSPSCRRTTLKMPDGRHPLAPKRTHLPDRKDGNPQPRSEDMTLSLGCRRAALSGALAALCSAVPLSAKLTADGLSPGGSAAAQEMPDDPYAPPGGGPGPSDPGPSDPGPSDPGPSDPGQRSWPQRSRPERRPERPARAIPARATPALATPAPAIPARATPARATRETRARISSLILNPRPQPPRRPKNRRPTHRRLPPKEPQTGGERTMTAPPAPACPPSRLPRRSL